LSGIVYKMKKWFQKLRMDAKFAKAGEGHKLTDDTRLYGVAFYKYINWIVLALPQHFNSHG